MSIWHKYEKARDRMLERDLPGKTEKNWRFFNGNQWKGVESDTNLPSDNIIKGIIKHKVSIIAQNDMVAKYVDLNDENPEACEVLNRLHALTWEKSNMKTKAWDIVKNACIQGDSAIYYGSGDPLEPQILHNTSILLADEQETDLQKQKHIIIAQRLWVDDIKKEAKENGMDESFINSITSDDEKQTLLGNKKGLSDGKCIAIIYMYKDSDGIVHFQKGVEQGPYTKDYTIRAKNAKGDFIGKGLKAYPMASFIWEKDPNDARGVSEVESLIPNQIEINKNLVRRLVSSKVAAYPRIAYDEEMIQNPEDLDKVGTAIAIKGDNARNVQNMIAFLEPSSASPDARSLSEEMTTNTKDHAGAGDTALGNIDLTRVSGAAISAVRDQNELPLNEQMVQWSQFVEQLALLWIELWCVYNPNGLSLKYRDETGELIEELIPVEDIEKLKLTVKVDVSKDTGWSRFAEQQALDNLLNNKHITLEEYSELLPEGGAIAKNKLIQILSKRKTQNPPEEEPVMQDPPIDMAI